MVKPSYLVVYIQNKDKAKVFQVIQVVAKMLSQRGEYSENDLVVYSLQILAQSD